MDIQFRQKAVDVVDFNTRWYSPGIKVYVKSMLETLELPTEQNILSLPGVKYVGVTGFCEKPTFSTGEVGEHWLQVQFNDPYELKDVSWQFSVSEKGNVTLHSKWAKAAGPVGLDFPKPFHDINMGRLKEKVVHGDTIDIACEYAIFDGCPDWTYSLITKTEALAKAKGLLRKLENM